MNGWFELLVKIGSEIRCSGEREGRIVLLVLT